MVHYIIQVLIFQTLFLGVYDLFLKKETFFQWNRAYLILTSLLAYVIPFIKIEGASNFVQNNFAMLPEVILNPEIVFLSEVYIQNTNNLLTLDDIYLIGVLLMFLLFLYKIGLISRKIYQNTILKKKAYSLVILPNQKTAFSFFKYLFLGQSLFEKEHQHIIKHELTHIKEKHSFDLMYFEVQKIICWFNPFSYLFQNRIAALHEFIADAKTIKQEDTTSFFENLLQQTFQVEKLSFINQFYKKSLIKKRIIMATKNKSQKIVKLKYLVLIPLLLVMFMYTSCSSEKEKNIETEVTSKAPQNPQNPPSPPNPETANLDEFDNVSLPFPKVEKVPTYPGCENLSNEEAKKCMSEKITKLISQKFNVDIANNLGLETGKKRISVQFKIDKNGDVVDIKARAPHPILEKEAIRVMGIIPSMQAGEQQGKKVTVRYNLPIVFNVE